MARLDTLKGYILEEILAYLIQNTGFRLLVNPAQDQRELARRGNGLVVQGRGGVHQVDVLGQLMWIPAFTFPIRLFVEAKCTRNKVGLPVIRNAVGVVNDINQNYSPIREGSNRLIKRYSYHYAVFSTVGFAAPAVDYAMAHQISLIDLSGPDFDDLREFLDNMIDLIADRERDQDADSEARWTRSDSRSGFVNNLRLYIRRILHTWPEGVPVISSRADNSPGILEDRFGFLNESLLSGSRRLGEMFVGMSNGPFLLIFKSQNPQGFLDYADRHPSHRVTITWSFGVDEGRQWTIRSAEDPHAYRLSFGLPTALADWIFSGDSGVTERALNAKGNFLKEILIYRYVGGRDRLYRLNYDETATRRQTRQ